MLACETRKVKRFELCCSSEPENVSVVPVAVVVGDVEPCGRPQAEVHAANVRRTAALVTHMILLPLWRRPVAGRDRVVRALHADGRRPGPDRDDDRVPDDIRLAGVPPPAAEQRQTLSDPDTVLGSLIDHHQPSRDSQRLTRIGEENPGRGGETGTAV